MSFLKLLFKTFQQSFLKVHILFYFSTRFEVSGTFLRDDSEWVSKWVRWVSKVSEVSEMNKWVRWVSDWVSEVSEWVSVWVTEWMNELSEVSKVSEMSEVSEWDEWVSEVNEVSVFKNPKLLSHLLDYEWKLQKDMVSA